MSALQYFFDAERLRRGWSVREAADRSQISLSKAYAIIRGDDNVEFETFESIAAAFGMTPAELATAIGKGNHGDDPDEVRMIAAYRLVPTEKRLTALDILQALTRVKPRPGDSAKPRRGRPNTHSSRPTSDDDDALARCYNPVSQGLMRSVSAA